MTNDELRALAEAAREHGATFSEVACDGDCPLEDFEEAASPERVIELLDEVDNQSCVGGRSIDTCRHCRYLREKLAALHAENERLGAEVQRLERVVDFGWHILNDRWVVTPDAALAGEAQ